MSYIITQTLLSSWSYMLSCRDECCEAAYTSFMNTLNRIPKESTPEIQNGIDFENEVYKEALGMSREPHKKWERGIRAVATLLIGSSVQVKTQRELFGRWTKFARVRHFRRSQSRYNLRREVFQ